MSNPSPPKPKPTAPVDPVKWIEGKTLAELEGVLYGTTILVPDALRFRLPDGSIRHDPVLIRVPGIPDLMQARFDAIAYIAKLAKNPAITDMKAAVEAVGQTYFQQIDSYAICAICTHERTTPGDGYDLPPRFMLLDLFLCTYLGDVIEDLLDHMGLLKKMIAPRLEHLTEAQFWEVCGAIATKGNLSPLGDMREDTWQGFLVDACARLWPHRTPS